MLLVEIDAELHTTRNTIQHHSNQVIKLSYQRMNTPAYDIGTKRRIDKAIKTEHDTIHHYTNCVDYAQQRRQDICSKLDVFTTQIKKG